MSCLGVNWSVAHRLNTRAWLSKPPHHPLLAWDTEPRRGHHYRRRRAPCFARVCCHLSTPRASPHTHRACTLACCPGRTACSPEYEFQRPPQSSCRRARPSAWSQGQPTIPEPPLGHVGATRFTHRSTPPLSSPESEHPRPQRHCSTAAARRRPLRPSQAPQSSTGKPNRGPGQLVAPP
jgi:hypothetical protein